MDVRNVVSDAGVKELDKGQLELVNGGIGWPGAIAGGIYGGIMYAGSATTTGTFSWGGLGTNIVGGAALGSIGGPIGSAAGRYLAPRVSYATGAISGLWDR